LKVLIDFSLSDARHYRHVQTGIDDMAETASSELNLRELRILNALLHERSITRTAQLLATTQPGISKVLRNLRAQFADPLFVRNGHAMQPTAKALEIADQLRTLLGAADGVRAAVTAFDPTQSDRTFSLLLTDVGMIRFLPPLIAHVAAIAPGINIRAMPLDSRQFELKLEAGEADLALGAFPKAARHLRRQRLFFDGYVSVVRNGHPRFAGLRSRAGFLAERHILVTASETGHAAHTMAQRVLALQIPSSNILLQVPSFVAGAIVAAETDALTTLPANLAKRLAGPLGLTAFETPIALPRIEISQYWHERYHRDAAHRWLRSITSDLYATTTQKRRR
jgi:DNA-binding transcriptional LysR family regulator